jgi:hypothetical protein
MNERQSIVVVSARAELILGKQRNLSKCVCVRLQPLAEIKQPVERETERWKLK